MHNFQIYCTDYSTTGVSSPPPPYPLQQTKTIQREGKGVGNGLENLSFNK